MDLTDGETYYDVLDLSSTATGPEIREAYARAKTTFHRDSAALYSLISPEERDAMLQQIETAYAVLSDPDRRREYDRNHGNLGRGVAEADANPFSAALPRLIATTTAPTSSGGSSRVISIDRAPPMDASLTEEELLDPPRTDTTASSEEAVPSFRGPTPLSASAPVPRAVTVPAPPLPASSAPTASRPASSAPRNTAPPAFTLDLDPALQQQLEIETLWPGSLFRRVREAQHISIEEMSGITKVSKTYLLAVEDEKFEKLPAPVYVRGFVAQLARALRIPPPKVEGAVKAYMSRYQAHADQTGK